MSVIAGSCSKCGAPFWLPSMWHGTTPPMPSPSCQCWNMPQVHTSSTLTITEAQPAPQVTREQAVEAMAKESWHGTDPTQWAIAVEIAEVSLRALEALGVCKFKE